MPCNINKLNKNRLKSNEREFLKKILINTIVYTSDFFKNKEIEIVLKTGKERGWLLQKQHDKDLSVIATRHRCGLMD